MQLGTLIERLSFEDDAGVALAALGDVILFSEIRSVGERFGESPGQYVANAAQRFAALASDEDWLGLMNAIERSHDPTCAALERMLRWALKADGPTAPVRVHPGCTCGGQGHFADRTREKGAEAP